MLSIEEALENTITKFNGLGGYEILGKCRRGGPVVGEKKENGQAIEENNFADSQKAEAMQIDRQLKKPIFKDSREEFEARMKKYLTCK